MPRPKFNDDPSGVWESSARRRRKKRGGFSMAGVRWFFDLDPMSMFVLGMGGLGFACAMLGILVPKAAYGAIAIGILLVVMGNLLFFLAACYSGVGCVLACMFIPFYSLYFLITNLDETWRPFVMSIAGAVLLIAGLVIKGAGDIDDERPIRSTASPNRGRRNREETTHRLPPNPISRPLRPSRSIRHSRRTTTSCSSAT